MQYDVYKNRVAANVNRDDLGVFIPDWVNEVREEISLYHPFTFLIYERTIAATNGTYAYEIDAGATTYRYNGVMLSLMYVDGSAVIKLPYLNNKLFDRLYPSNAAGDPTCYTVRGYKFYVDKNPATVAGENYIAKYYMLPDRLSGSTDEDYIDKRYYNAVIAGACAKAAAYMMATELVIHWTKTYEKEVKKMIAQDTGLRLSDINLHIGSNEKKSPVESLGD